ncbi:MAG: DUF5667 domain-containing protein [Candidatus Staskawiczbacteria bacterium]|jgi:hypothetical protein
MNKILSIVLVVSVLASTGVVYAQTSGTTAAGMTPDSSFYFLKTWKESIQTFFTFGAENKAKQFMHLADVRLAEYEKMLEKGKATIAQRVLDKYNAQLNRAVTKIEEIKAKGNYSEDLLSKIEEIKAKGDYIIGGKKKKENGCTNSGGTIVSGFCCASATDFPSSCAIGACGCSLENSHEVKTCDCGQDRCFDGEKCVSFQQGG